MLKKILGWAVVAFMVFFVVNNPTGAAATVRHIGSGLAGMGASLGTFFASLSGGVG